MANPEHLEELKKGADSWKKWLLHLDEKNFHRENIDLRGANLSGREKDWSEYDFIGVNLKGANLSFSTLTEANFLGADLSGAEVNFKEGEFEKFITKAQNTVDLIFTNGIDWQAFLEDFLKLKSETGDELSIYSIEDKWDGYFVVRVNVPPDADKKEIETLLRVKDTEIEGFRREILTLQHIIESKPQIIQQIFLGEANGIAAIVEGNQNIYPPKADNI
jgi:Pentapeptide repeats (8 copies)